MPTERRKDLVRLARRHDALIISDDVYDLLQWPVNFPLSPRVPPDASPEMIIPRLCDIDLGMEPSTEDPQRFGYAVSNGSFSKMAGPGMRTGWLEGSKAFAFGLAQTGATKSGGAPSQFCAAVIADMVASGALQEYLATTVRPALQQRHRVTVEAIHHDLHRHGVSVRQTGLVDGGVYGGYFVWLTLPDGVSAELVAELCLEENLVIGSGSMFAVHGDEHSVNLDRYLRLTFSYVEEEDLALGVKRLASVLRKILEDPAAYKGWKGPGRIKSDIIDSSK